MKGNLASKVQEGKTERWSCMMGAKELAHQQGTDSPTVAIGASDGEWDGFLATNRNSHHEQCSEYARSRMQYGFHCDRVVVRKGSRIIGGAQVLSQSTPIGTYAQISRGPLAESDDPHVMQQVVEGVEDLAQQRSFAAIRVDTLPPQDAARRALDGAGFNPTLAWYRTKPSFLIPLDCSQEDLLRNMHRNVRYSIRLAERLGVTIRFGNEADISHFYDMHRMTASHQGFCIFPIQYFQYLWDHFGPHGKVQYFVAYLEDRPIAAIFNPIAGDRMYYGWGGIHNGSTERKARPNYLLHVTALEWAREHQCTHYDLSGDQEFKKQLAIDTIEWPPPMRKFYGALRSIRRKAMEVTSDPHYRRLVNKAARRLGVRAKSDMPW